MSLTPFGSLKHETFISSIEAEINDTIPFSVPPSFPSLHKYFERLHLLFPIFSFVCVSHQLEGSSVSCGDIIACHQSNNFHSLLRSDRPNCVKKVEPSKVSV